MIFELAQDVSDAISAMPESNLRYRLLTQLEKAVRQNIQFIECHPTILFQLLHNFVVHGASEEAQDWAVRARTDWEGARECPWLESLTSDPSATFMRIRLTDFPIALSQECAISASGQAGVVSGMGGVVVKHDLDDGRNAGQWYTSRRHFMPCAVSRNGQWVLVALPDWHHEGQWMPMVDSTCLGIWDGTVAPNPLRHFESAICRIALADDDDHIAVVTLSEELWLISRTRPERAVSVSIEQYVPPDEKPPKSAGFSVPPLSAVLRARIAFGANGRVLVLTSGQNLVLFNSQDGTVMCATNLDSARIDDCAASAEPFRICLIAGGEMILYEVGNPRTLPRPERRLRAHAEIRYRLHFSPFSCAISRDGSRLFTGSAIEPLKVWRWPCDEPEAMLHAPGCVDDVACSADGLRAISLDHAGASVWDVPADAAIVADNVFANVFAFAIDGLGRQIAMADRSGKLRLWNRNSKQAKVLSWSPTGNLRECLLSLDGRFLVVVDDRRGFSISLKPFDQFRDVGSALQTPIGRAILSPDGGLLATASLDATIRLWSTWTWELIAEMRPPATGLTDFAFTTDGANLISVNASGELRRWSVPDGELDAVVQLEFDPVPFANGDIGRQLAMSGDGRVICVTNWQCGHVALDSRSLRLLGEFGGHKHVRNTLALLGRSSCICTVHGVSPIPRHQLGLWDSVELTERGVLEGHDAEVTSCQSFPDGLHLLTNGEDGWMKVWNTESRQMAVCIPAPAKPRPMYINISGDLIAGAFAHDQLRLFRLHLRWARCPPAIVAWRDYDGGLYATCLHCQCEIGFRRAIFPLDEHAFGTTVQCPMKHELWVLRWPLGNVPIWCNRDYWTRFIAEAKANR